MGGMNVSFPGCSTVTTTTFVAPAGEGRRSVTTYINGVSYLTSEYWNHDSGCWLPVAA